MHIEKTLGPVRIRVVFAVPGSLSIVTEGVGVHIWHSPVLEADIKGEDCAALRYGHYAAAEGRTYEAGVQKFQKTLRMYGSDHPVSTIDFPVLSFHCRCLHIVAMDFHCLLAYEHPAAGIFYLPLKGKGYGIAASDHAIGTVVIEIHYEGVLREWGFPGPGGIQGQVSGKYRCSKRVGEKRRQHLVHSPSLIFGINGHIPAIRGETVQVGGCADFVHKGDIVHNGILLMREIASHPFYESLPAHRKAEFVPVQVHDIIGFIVQAAEFHLIVQSKVAEKAVHSLPRGGGTYEVHTGLELGPFAGETLQTTADLHAHIQDGHIVAVALKYETGGKAAQSPSYYDNFLRHSVLFCRPISYTLRYSVGALPLPVP